MSCISLEWWQQCSIVHLALVMVGLSLTVARWIPIEERGLLCSIIYAGVEIGGVTSSLTAGGILSLFPGQWQLPYYFNAVIGCTWLILWLTIGSKDPDSNKYITEHELKYLKESIVISKERPPVPWKKLLTSQAMIAGCIGNIGTFSTLFLFIMGLPKYLRQALNFSVAEETLWITVTYLSSTIAAIFFGYLFDKLLAGKILSITAARKACATIALGGVSISYIGMAVYGSDTKAVLCFLCFGFVALGGLNCSLRLLSNDISPQYAGVVATVTGIIVGICASLMPYLVGILVPNQTIEEWKLVFILLPIINLTALTIYLIFGSAEVQNWNYPTTLSDPIEGSTEPIRS